MMEIKLKRCLILDNRHDRYLSAQRNFKHTDIDKICSSFVNYYNSIKSYLPSKVDNILDIGCGLGITDLVFHLHYNDNNIKYNLCDKTEYNEQLYFGFQNEASAYNDLYPFRLVFGEISK